VDLKSGKNHQLPTIRGCVVGFQAVACRFGSKRTLHFGRSHHLAGCGIDLVQTSGSKVIILTDLSMSISTSYAMFAPNCAASKHVIPTDHGSVYSLFSVDVDWSFCCFYPKETGQAHVERLRLHDREL